LIACGKKDSGAVIMAKNSRAVKLLDETVRHVEGGVNDIIECKKRHGNK
jgi:hypothetical protein